MNLLLPQTNFSAAPPLPPQAELSFVPGCRCTPSRTSDDASSLLGVYSTVEVHGYIVAFCRGFSFRGRTGTDYISHPSGDDEIRPGEKMAVRDCLTATVFFLVYHFNRVAVRGCLTAIRNAAGCETFAGNNSVLRKKFCTGARTHEGSKEMISAESGFQDFGINPTLAGL